MFIKIFRTENIDMDLIRITGLNIFTYGKRMLDTNILKSNGHLTQRINAF